ncbi:MAG: Abortive infection protein [Myxococcaceae bacterium]|nr:Abortive infection protein [Myxococcaceae bacterium]
MVLGVELSRVDAPRGVLVEVLRVYVVIALVTLLVSHTPGSFMIMYGHLLLAAAFLGLALTMARRDPRGAVYYGIDLAGLLEASPDEPLHYGHGLWFALRRALPSLLRELGVALLVALLVFPPFVLAFQLWHQPQHPFTWHLPAQPVDFALTQLVAIATPEEALFRGYFQTRLSDLSAPAGQLSSPTHKTSRFDLFTRTRRLLGADVSLAALTSQAALFALLHFLVGFSPARLAVFFPGLLFGWLRARRGGIGAASWFHALCNLLADVLTRGYL